MHAHLKFENVEFDQDSTDLVRVKKGEALTIQMMDAPPFTWATTKDPVLSVIEQADHTIVDVITSRSGTSEVQVQEGHNVTFYLTIQVFDPEEAGGFDSSNPPVIEPIT